jgi:hypothetical protein
VVLATVRPTLRLRIERDLQGSQHAVAIPHDILIGETNHAKAEFPEHLLVAAQIHRAIVSVAIDLYRQALGRAEEVDNARTDHILAAELVAEALPGTQRSPQVLFGFRGIVTHFPCAFQQDFAGDATTPNPLL